MKKLCMLAALIAPPAFADQPITLNFSAEIAGQPFACDATYTNVGATGADVTARDFRTYLSQVAMIAADGSAVPVTLDADIWQNDGVVLLDFEDGSAGCTNGTVQTNTSIRGQVPDGDYVGIRFDVGVPFAQNHDDPTLAASPLNVTSMFWNWRAGYKFVRIDMVPTDRRTDGPDGWFLHLGSTMCEAASMTQAPAAPCANPNRMVVQFDEFDPANDTIVIDPAPVVAQADMRTNTPDTSPGCMSFPGDPECLTVMAKLGLDYMNVPAQPQQLFVKR